MLLSFYNTPDLCNRYSHLNGVELLHDHKILTRTINGMFHDRTETVKFPINLANVFPIPNLPQHFDKSYEQICLETAEHLATRAIRENKKLRILWSGGIDSTLIVVCFLKLNYNDLLEVAISYESIYENPYFYLNHLIKKKIKLIPATNLKQLCAPEYILIGGEYNDQLLGSNLIITFEKYFDSSELFKPFNKDVLKKIFDCDSDLIKNPKNIDAWIDAYSEICKKSPIPIESNLDFHWWINFSCKWQGLYYRLSSYFNKDFNLNDYIHFFQNEDFQIWSILNHSQQFEGYQHYKKICRDLIFEYDGNNHYRDNKKKIESLFFLAQKNHQFNYTDDKNFSYYDLPEDSINHNFKSLL